MNLITVDINIENNILSYKVLGEQKYEIKNVNLLLYGNNVFRRQTSDKTGTFELSKEGIYVVAVEVLINEKIEKRFSYPKSYFTETSRNDFDIFCKMQPRVKANDIPIYVLKKPFALIGIIYHKNKNKDRFDPKKISSELTTKKFKFNGNICHLISSDTVAGKNVNYVFSGMAKHNHKFIFGQDDVTEGKVFGMNDCIGNFSYIASSKSKIEIASDFFGLSKMSVFENDDYLIASNQYHLLLLIMQQLEIKTTFNYDIIKATLCSNHYMVAQQVFEKDAIVNGVKTLRINEKIIIENDEIKVEKTNLDALLNEPPKELTNQEYLTRLNKGIDEVKENIEILFKNPKIEKVTFDLTGGLDSRMVMSALTNIKDYQNKVTLRTLDIGEDLNVALDIANMLNLKFDSAPAYLNEFDEVVSDKSSMFMGGTYKAFPLKYENVYDEKTRIYCGGGYGEQVTRYYLTKDFFKSYIEKIDDISLFTTEFIKQISKETVSFITSYDTAVKHFEKELQKEMSEFSGYDNMEKLESHFLIYRGSLHFKQYLYIGNLWCPMLSKTMFKLFKNVARNNDYFKLAFEFVLNANEVLGNMKYGDAGYNDAFEKLRDKFILNNERFRRMSFAPNYDRTKKDEAQKQKIQEKKKLPIKFTDMPHKIEQYNNLNKFAHNEAFSLVAEIAKLGNGELYDVAFEIFKYLKSIDSSSIRVPWIWTRLKTIIEQYNLIR